MSNTPNSGERGRFSSRRKTATVLRLLRGEDLELALARTGRHRRHPLRLAGRLPGRRPGRAEEPADRRPGRRDRPAAGQGRRADHGQRAADSSGAGPTALSSRGGGGRRPGRLPLHRAEVRPGPRLPPLGPAPLDGLLPASSADHPHRPAAGTQEARPARPLLGRGTRRPHPPHPDRVAVPRRGLPQGLGPAPLPGHPDLQGAGPAADARARPPGPAAGRPSPRPEGPRRDDHHRAPRRDVGDRHDHDRDHRGGPGLRLRRRRPLHRRSASASTPRSRATASRRWSRSARASASTSAASTGASPRGWRSATTTAAPT